MQFFLNIHNNVKKKKKEKLQNNLIFVSNDIEFGSRYGFICLFCDSNIQICNHIIKTKTKLGSAYLLKYYNLFKMY